jgi:hypothetical protein
LEDDMECSRDLWTAALSLLRHASLPPNRSYSVSTATLCEVVVSAARGRVRIDGFDLSTEMTVQFRSDGDLDPCTVPLGSLWKLTQAGKRTAGEEMSVVATATGLRLEIGGRTFELARGSPVEDRPRGLAGPGWETAEIQSHGVADFMRALDYCAPAMSTDPTRANIAGLYIGDGHMVATDGHRMHVARHIPSFAGGPAVLVPSTVAALQAAIRAAEPSWIMARYVRATPPLVQLSLDGVLLDVLITARCGDRDFPPWRAVCPDHKQAFAVDHEKWQAASSSPTCSRRCCRWPGGRRPRLDSARTRVTCWRHRPTATRPTAPSASSMTGRAIRSS